MFLEELPNKQKKVGCQGRTGIKIADFNIQIFSKGERCRKNLSIIASVFYQNIPKTVAKPIFYSFDGANA